LDKRLLVSCFAGHYCLENKAVFKREAEDFVSILRHRNPPRVNPK
jgi:hypothetical protein